MAQLGLEARYKHGQYSETQANVFVLAAPTANHHRRFLQTENSQGLSELRYIQGGGNTHIYIHTYRKSV